MTSAARSSVSELGARPGDGGSTQADGVHTFRALTRVTGGCWTGERSGGGA